MNIDWIFNDIKGFFFLIMNGIVVMVRNSKKEYLTFRDTYIFTNKLT